MHAAETVRDARPEDLAAIVAIYNATIPDRLATADLEPVEPETREDWLAAHTPDRRPLWVAEVDGRVVAWLSFSDFYGRPAYGATAELGVYVHEAVRGAGLGRRLVDRAVRRAPGLGIRTLLALVFAHNVPSLRLFDGAGFERWGLLPDVAELDGVRRSLAILGRPT